MKVAFGLDTAPAEVLAVGVVAEAQGTRAPLVVAGCLLVVQVIVAAKGRPNAVRAIAGVEDPF